VVLPTPLLAHLHDLTVSIGDDDQDFDDTLLALTTAALDGFLLRLPAHNCRERGRSRRRLTDGHDVGRDALRLPSGCLSDGPMRAELFYAGVAGASPI
jgi:hypothetical protein